MSESNGGTGRSPNLALQKERLRRGWTQQELADQVGTTIVNVSRWERGATSPNPYFRQKLCEVFEKDANELGLLSVRQGSRRETELIFEEITPNLPEEEFVTTTHQSTSLSLRQHFFGRRRTVVTLISSALAVLATGGGLFIYGHQQPLAPGAVIGRDTFQRANQVHWGTASDGQSWAGDANTLTNFSITNHTAKITTGSGSIYNALLGAPAKDAEVLFSGSISSFDNSNLGSTLRWHDNNNYYKAYIDSKSLVIRKNLNGVLNYLAVTPFPTMTGTSYTIRFRAVRTSLLAKAWPTGTEEPHDWMATTIDSAFTSGFCGLRIQAVNDATATVTSFQAIAL